MTLRNWAIGYYIVEYEQDGSDRAEYGSHLLKNLEKQIDQKGMNYTLFKACRQFYKVYPQIGSTVSSEFKLPDFGKSSTVSNEFVTDPDVLVNNLSFSHIREIMVLNDAFERFSVFPFRLSFSRFPSIKHRAKSTTTCPSADCRNTPQTATVQ